MTRRQGARVWLAFDLDTARWPWLRLPPQHAVVVEKYQYFSSMTAGWALGLLGPGVFTALTEVTWDCGEGRDGHSPRGYCELETDGPRDIRFNSRFTDRSGAQAFHISGRGHVFPDGDFAARRAARHNPPSASIAPHDAFLRKITNEAGRWRADCLVGRVNGFHPAHRFHTGSGDHVNAAQLYDCALQVAAQAAGHGAIRCTGGSAEFKRFTELDQPFALHAEPSTRADEWRFLVSQSGRETARLALRLATDESGARTAVTPPR